MKFLPDMKTDYRDMITTIVLTYNEEKHIRRCLNNVCPLSKTVFVVDSGSTDRTAEICSEFSNVVFVTHQWPGNQAEQIDWALRNLKVTTGWILRIDADEYLSEELIYEIRHVLPVLPDEVTGLMMKRDVVFLGKRIRYGRIRPLKLLRLWRNGCGWVESRIMDEHIVLSQGKCLELANYFYDDNRNGIDAWTMKHLDYAGRESKIAYRQVGGAVSQKESVKSRYYSLPLFHRCFWFFVFRYVFLLGFLDGRAGFLWHFLQCFWYRTIVDVKISERGLLNDKRLA